MSLSDLNKLIDSGIKLTPMMEQYYHIKKNYADTLLLFRMGDFYEVFFEDAKTTSKILNITLTHRGKIGDTPIPMAGIPHHAANVYIDRLTNHGLKVAICEQIENPKDAQGIVKRGVTRVVSPGMPFDLEKTPTHEHRFMVSTYKKDTTYYVVALDFTTGTFTGHQHQTHEDFIETIRHLAPREFITYMGQWDDDNLNTLIEHYGILKTHLSEDYFDQKFTDVYIEKLIPNFKRDKFLESEKNILNAIGALAYYVASTQLLDSFIHIRPFRLINENGLMKVTLPTLLGLEILPKSKESYKDSLLGLFDKTQTAMGARLLRAYFLRPLVDLKQIEKRHDIIHSFLAHSSLIAETKNELSTIRDLERILAKISMMKGTSGDLINLARAINSYEKIKAILNPVSFNFTITNKNLLKLKQIADKILDTLNDEIGASLEKGNLIKEGINPTRDRLAKLHLNVAESLIEMESKLREETGIQKLRIKSNNVAGFFIEVSKGSTTKVPHNFERRQTLVNAERYTTKELEDLEKDTLSAKDRLEKLEREIFKELITNISEEAMLILNLSEELAKIDVSQSLSTMALNEDLTRPQFETKKKIIHVEQGFHPLIKSLIKDQFVCHDLHLDHHCYFGLITGPNMAGKTTVMREMAIIQLLAQIGSYVPAKFAKLSLCDFLFSRLGASDDILKGQSTFMVEMAETAEILRHATDRSLIILDEVGRGTSTYDGLSIAWGLVEHFIHETKALTLFATHYHELIDVAEKTPEAKNLTVETTNHLGNVQFLYRLIEKSASQSYGLYVAKLAGIPRSILSRSEKILAELERNHNPMHTPSPLTFGNQLSFLDEVKMEIEIPKHLKTIEDELNKIDPLKMTPIDALLKLDELKKQIHLH